MVCQTKTCFVEEKAEVEFFIVTKRHLTCVSYLALKKKKKALFLYPLPPKKKSPAHNLKVNLFKLGQSFLTKHWYL